MSAAEVMQALLDLCDAADAGDYSKPGVPGRGLIWAHAVRGLVDCVVEHAP